MSQSWTSDSFAAGHVAQTDLQKMENNFLALQSSFSGAVQPAGAVAGQLWFDTAQLVLKTRNGDNDEWFGVFCGDVSQEILVYRNDIPEGYARDSTPTDKVIALKGGATYVTGGASAGSWTVSGLTSANESSHSHSHSHTGPSHYHQWYDYKGGSVSATWQVNGTTVNIATGGTGTGIYSGSDAGAQVSSDYYTNTPVAVGNTGSDATAGSAHNHTVSQNGAWRILAAVVIMLYLDL